MQKAHSSYNWKKWRVISGVYLLTSAVFVVQRIVFDMQNGKPEDIPSSILDLIGFTGIWILFTIPIISLASGKKLTPLNIAMLIGIGLVFSFLHAAAYLLYGMSVPGVFSDVTIASVAKYFSTLAGLSHAWRFLSFGFLVALSYAYDYYFLSLERERQSARLQVQLTEAKLETLKMQLQPHFLFNTLNAISVLIDDNPEAARQTLAQLSDLLRIALEHSQSQEVSLSREMEFIDHYLRIQQTRYGDRLVIRKQVGPDTLDATVPPMILQPVVENALKHGIDSVPGKGIITITSNRKNGSLVLQVEDSGSGLSPGSNGRGLGLENTRGRLP